MFRPLNPLFSAPPFISQYFTDEFSNHGSLSSAEELIVAQAIPKRVADFTTGRYCARQALLDLIKDGPEILQGKGREPLWPNAIVGSISHSSKLAGAVVAKQENIAAIGLDIENINGIKADMWNLIFNEGEQEFIRNKQDVTFWATLLFSLKESFYKMQYPLTGLFLEFTDIMILETGEQFCLSQENPEHDLSAIDFSNIKTQWTINGDQLITLCYL